MNERAKTIGLIADMLCKIADEKLLNRIYRFTKYIYLHRDGKGGGGMTNNERFNAALNSCQNPQAVYDALLVLMKANDRELDLTLRFLRNMVEVTE